MSCECSLYAHHFTGLSRCCRQQKTYRLKHRVRVSEMWISECVDEVTDASISLENAFVFGWPTCNLVAAFRCVYCMCVSVCTSVCTTYLCIWQSADIMGYVNAMWSQHNNYTELWLLCHYAICECNFRNPGDNIVWVESS